MIASATVAMIVALDSIPVFAACTPMSPTTTTICSLMSLVELEDVGDAGRVLGRDRGDCRRAVHAVDGERLQIGLDAGAAARVRPCDRQRHRNSHAVLNRRPVQ